MLLLALLLEGCGSTRAEREHFAEEFRAGRYEEAANYAGGPALHAAGLESWRLIETLEAGAAYRAAGKHELSCQLFDRAEDIIKTYDEQSLVASSADTLSALVVNDNMMPYRGGAAEGVMVNVFKALNFLAEGKSDLARVELNRADERQRRAVERFAAKIKKQQEAIAEKSRQSPDLDIERSLTNPELQRVIASKYDDLDTAVQRWAAYPDFVNPFATYLQGLALFLLAEDAADYEKAREALARVYGMTGRAPRVERDWEMVSAIADRKADRASGPPLVWTIFENGLGPVKDEIRIDIPLLLKQVKYVGIALPKLRFRDAAYPALEIRDGSQVLDTTEELFELDAVVAKEFQLELPQVVTRATLSALLKAGMQYAATEAGGQLGSVLGAVYSAVTTSADTRIWSSLPKNFQIARCARPSDGRLRIGLPGSDAALLDIELPQSRFTIVYIKIPAAGVAPSYEIFASPA